MATSSGKHIKKHHEQNEHCYKRPTYREPRRERAVKVYTINQESKYLLVLGVPTVGATKELLEQFALYGDIEEYRILDEYPVEKFTEAYWIKYKRIQSARFGKKKLDNHSFFGGLLHVCYAPEYESENDTREKLDERKRAVARKCKEYFSPAQNPSYEISTKTEQPSTSPSTILRPSKNSYTLITPPPPPPLSPHPPAPKIQGASFLQQTPMTTSIKGISKKLVDYPKIRTNQATLPLELQNLTASEVYPNQRSNCSLTVPPLNNQFNENTESYSGVSYNEIETIEIPNFKQQEISVDVHKKRIVWNKRAPENPFNVSHQYTRKPGAWNPYAEVKSKDLTDEDKLEGSVNAIRRKLQQTAEPAQNIQQYQEMSPLAMVSNNSTEETRSPQLKKSRKNDGRKRI